MLDPTNTKPGASFSAFAPLQQPVTPLTQTGNPLTAGTGAVSMASVAPMSSDTTVASPNQAQAQMPASDTDLDQLGQNFLLIAQAINRFTGTLLLILPNA
jgi:hypothetical protein